jgi:hypothetical protein
MCAEHVRQLGVNGDGGIFSFALTQQGAARSLWRMFTPDVLR